ncbi:MAG: hypothetical protein K6E93_08810 [Bacteroidales bacterium]|nr:hypothetical protein [Bacteroidales bacterium]
MRRTGISSASPTGDRSTDDGLEENRSLLFSRVRYDADRCHQYRDNPDNQERASTHTVMKCMRCMTVCDKKSIKELLK